MLCFVLFFSFFVRPAPLLCGGRPGREPSRPVVFAPSSFGLFPCSRNRRGLGGGLAPLRSTAVARRATPSSLSYRLVASFQWTLPLSLPVGRDCKGNNFFPFRQITAAGFSAPGTAVPRLRLPGFSAPGTAVPRLRLQRYYQISLSTKFFHNFFQRFSCMIRQLPTIQTHNSLIPSTPTIIHANCYCMQKGRNTSIQHASPLFIHIK